LLSGPKKQKRKERPLLERGLRGRPVVRGRITEAQLPLAEESFPGICDVYAALDLKPATFLQLLFIYEEICKCEPGWAQGPSRRA
jgi:hypothetical protein